MSNTDHLMNHNEYGNGHGNGNHEKNNSNNNNNNNNSNEEMKRTVKFVLFSVSAGVIEIGAFTLLFEVLHWSYWVSYLIALVLSVLWNFTLNREFTFRSANNVPVAMMKVAAYYAVFTPVTTILGNWLTESCGWNGMVVTGLNMLLNFVTEYLYDRYFVFGKSIDTNKRAQAKGKSE
jgi:putative flippase GtrA